MAYPDTLDLLNETRINGQVVTPDDYINIAKRVNALMRKLGNVDSTPSLGKALAGISDGQSMWRNLQASDFASTFQAINTNMLWSPDNAWDIGAALAGRPRDIYVGRNAIFGGSPWFDIRSFGWKQGDPDASVAIRAAYTAALNVGYGVVYLPAGIITVDNASNVAAILIERNHPGMIVFQGAGIDVTTLKLTNNTKRVADFNKIADHDLFRYITMQDFTVDNNNVNDKSNIILGNYKTNSFQTYLQYLSLFFRRIKVINVPVDPTLVTSHRLHFNFGLFHAAGGEATQDTAKNFVFQDLELYGGHQGVAVVGMGSNPTNNYNYFIDNILCDNIIADQGAVPNAQFASANIQIGSRAPTGRITLRRIRGASSGDVGFEVDSFDYCLIVDSEIRNANNIAYLWTNFATPPHGIDNQVLHVVNSSGKLDGITNTSSNGTGFATDTPVSLGFGHVILDDCQWYSNRVPKTLQGSAYHNATATPMKSLTIRDFIADCEGWTINPTGATYSVVMFFFNPSGAMELNLENIRVKWNGTIQAGAAFGLVAYDLFFNSGECVLNVRGVRPQCDVVTNSIAFTHRHMDQNSAGGVTLRGIIKGLRPIAETGVGGTFQSVLIRGTAILTVNKKLILDENDWSDYNGTEVVFATGNENKDKVRYGRNNIWKTNPVVLGTITVPASGIGWQNLTGFPVWVISSGGTVTQIAQSVDNATYVDTGEIAGAWLVEPAQWIKWTYSVVPTTAKYIPAG